MRGTKSITVFSTILLYCSCIVIDEPCRTEAYPPPADTAIEAAVLNLDLPPEERWAHIVGPKKEHLIELLDVIKTLISPQVLNVIDSAMESVLKWLPVEYGKEIQGIADVAGIDVGEAVLYNIFYELFSVCTSIVGHNEQGKMYHARNLDFGLLMGWDNETNTWMVTERLRKLMVTVEYQQNGRTIFKALHFAGYVGVATSVKANAFTLTVNERFSLDGGYLGIIEWMLGKSKGQWMGFLTRDTMLKAENYTAAKAMLSNTELLAPVYFILGGLKPTEACIVTRSREITVNTLEISGQKGQWYLLETNYDNWKAPLFFDDRRTPGKKCMNQITQTGMGFKGLFNVLSTRSVLNKLTAYTALMQVDSGILDGYIQDCLDPCWPW